jgi:uncharacterized protein YjbI with pentapeptide repeats
VADAKKIDPFDVEALEKSLNDSATRVSTIWISFLIFALYLLAAATTVTHRQLLLAEPVKLPVLSIELPLWGFFFLAPILFVIFHVYVLLQVLLLGRTAAAYNEALDRAVRPPPSNAAMRQRLANTLFAQIFAGSPRERDGWLGWLLKAMAWITLAIAPILILLTFQFAFLPYHSHVATWTHRLLILMELAAVFLLWPLALDTMRDFSRQKITNGFQRLVLLSKALATFFMRPFVARKGIWNSAPPRRRPHRNFYRLGQSAFPAISVLLFVVVCLSFATFPGEPHVNLITGQPPFAVQCDRWIQRKFQRLDLRFDRLLLPGVQVVDDEKLAKIAKATSDRKLPPWLGERLRIFRDRDFNCSELPSADLRGVDLSGAQMSGALLFFADLQRADLSRVLLRDAFLNGVQLQSALLYETQLQRTALRGARLQGSFFYNAGLQGADLGLTGLQGARLESSRLEGVDLRGSLLQGASLIDVQLHGALLVGDLLHGASFIRTGLQGADFSGAQLQGASFDQSVMTLTDLSNAFVWRAKAAACHDARVSKHRPDAVIHLRRIAGKDDEPVQAVPKEIDQFIEDSTADIPDQATRERINKRMHASLVADSAKDDAEEIAHVWSTCEEAAKGKTQAAFDEERAVLLRDLVCGARDNREAIASGIIRNWISNAPDRRAFSARLARGLLGLDGKACAATKDIDEPTREYLRVAIASANVQPVTSPVP